MAFTDTLLAETDPARGPEHEQRLARSEPRAIVEPHVRGAVRHGHGVDHGQRRDPVRGQEAAAQQHDVALRVAVELARRDGLRGLAQGR